MAFCRWEMACIRSRELRWVLMASKGTGLLDVLIYGGRELLLALPFVVPLHFLYSFFYQRFHFYD